MKTSATFIKLAALAAVALVSPAASAKPLTVYILAGQSNMEGQATVGTFNHIGMDPKTAPMLAEMRDKDGSPVVVDDVHIAYLSADGEKNGQLTAGFAAPSKGAKIGPEFTFGIYMRKHVDEPILIIKTAWGGKSLHTNFRPPSAGPYVFTEQKLQLFKERGTDIEAEKVKKAEATGHYYRLMIDHVKKVLADPKKYHPAYNPKDGYKIAGFVWFQGWNDMVDRGTYPNRGGPGGYAKYGEWMADFIRDVRKDLKTPKMPFVIGVMGVGGVIDENYNPRYKTIHGNFRAAMASPTKLPEFTGNVAAVHTGQYWDSQLAELDKRMWQVAPRFKEEQNKRGKMSKQESKALRENIVSDLFTEKELEILKTGKSNKRYHYLGSSKIMAQIGKGFAEAMAELQGQ